MPVNCVLSDIFFCFHKAVSFCICLREGLFLFVLAASYGGPHFKCVSWCPCPKCVGSFLYLQKMKWAFPHKKQWYIYLILPLKLWILLFRGQNCHIPLISHAALAMRGQRGNSTLLFLYRSLLFLYSYYFDATWIYIKRLFQRIWIHSVCTKCALKFSWIEHTVHFYYNDLFMTEWNLIDFSYLGTLPVKDF